MEQPVSFLMSTPVVTARADDTIESVSAQLSENGLSFVPVIDSPKGALLGVISAADIIQFKSAKRDPAAVRAWEICLYKPLEVNADAPISELARLMVERQEHHVVVMSKETVVGVVTSFDFVKAFIKPA
ncbi:CBS domain-containing protein [Massilia sp. RP-1-19]|uniref:CBS domain-containing protein n=1 Tax=Massilia polaris TaxID=2728846 RepID=A0A848HNA8_9BURK|nr:CBS domain-containing protein [Massilia polaris]NML60753.1 CBS domain-containing protein [Massilia polaris]